MTDQRVAVVVPSHLENLMLQFIEKWEEEFIRENVTLYVIEDHQEKSFQFPKTKLPIKHFSWDNFDADLGKNSWIISRRTSAGKSYGFWKAYQDNQDIIIALDHDCFPDQKDTIAKHKKALQETATLGWVTSVGTPTRGFPYQIRGKSPVVVNHGGWSNIPDFDGPQMLQYPDVRFNPLENESKVIPYKNYFPLCGMNFAFTREVTPSTYFLLQGPDWPFDRFDDIWGGILMKKITDHFHHAMLSGAPSIHHEKGTDPFVAVRKESTGLPVNEWLWKAVDEIPLTATTYKDAYKELATGLSRSEFIKKSEYHEYFLKLTDAMNIWADLF